MVKGSKKTPQAGTESKALPIIGNPENTVMIGGQPVEIKATKLKYLRNGTANLYRLLEQVPLSEIMMIGEYGFGPNDSRDGDKAVMDWLIAVTDNEQLIVDHYDDMDVAQIEQMLEIFKRVNRFAQKEENLKNAQPPREEA